MDNNNDYSCENQPVSQEYADFIVEFQELPEYTKMVFSSVCSQKLGWPYSVLYSPLESVAQSINDSRYSYHNIPKLYSFDNKVFTVTNEQMASALQVSGIERIRRQPALGLTGKQVIVGIITSGIDYRDSAFRYSNGDTRILRIWDQTNNQGNRPEGWSYGTEWTEEDINRSLAEETNLGTSSESNHGNLLLKAACGRIESDNIEDRFEGAAPDAIIIAVKLKEAKNYLKDYYCLSREKKAYQENDIMAAITYIREKIIEFEMPAVMLITSCTSMGGHEGRLPLDIMAGITAESYGTCIVQSNGNSANKRRHYRGSMLGFRENEPQTVELKVGEESGIYMELWFSNPEIYTVGIVSPSGETIERVPRQNRITRYNLLFANTEVTIENKIIEGRDNYRLVIIKMCNPSSGIWRINVYGENIVSGIFDVWLPSNDFIGDDTYFLMPDPDITLTEPACTSAVLSVGAFNPITGGALTESGRGFTRDERVKPEISSPATAGGIVDTAAAVAAGASAMFMEWAFTDRNAAVRTSDIINFFVQGAVRDRNEMYPSKIYGYGKLDIYNSFSEY